VIGIKKILINDAYLSAILGMEFAKKSLKSPGKVLENLNKKGV